MADHEAKMIAASDAVAAGVTDPATLAEIGTTPDGATRVSALLRADHLSLFAGRDADRMGEPLDRAFAVVADPSCLGSLDVVQPLGQDGGSGAEVEGWAWDGRERRAPAEVVFADQSGRIVGLAHGRISRPDVQAANSAVTSDRVGFQGFLAPDSGSDVSAYAAMEDGEKACRIGG